MKRVIRPHHSLSHEQSYAFIYSYSLLSIKRFNSCATKKTGIDFFLRKKKNSKELKNIHNIQNEYDRIILYTSNNQFLPSADSV